MLQLYTLQRIFGRDHIEENDIGGTRSKHGGRGEGLNNKISQFICHTVWIRTNVYDSQEGLLPGVCEATDLLTNNCTPEMSLV